MKKDQKNITSFEKAVQSIRENLRPGGLGVDFAAIHLLAAGELDEEQTRLVRQRIVTWETWNSAYWDVVDALAEEERMTAEAKKESDETDTDNLSEFIRVPGNQSAVGRRRFFVLATLAAAIVVGVVIVTPWGDGELALITQLDDPLGQVGKTAAGEIVGLDVFPSKWRDSIATMIKSETAAFSADRIAQLHRVRSSDQPSMYIRPVATVVAAAMPSLQWTARGDNVSYQVRVYLGQNVEPVVQSDKTHKATQWKMTEQLKRGQIYTWEVVVFRDGKPFISDEPRPSFRVLSEKKFEAVERVKAESGGSHLLLTAVYLEYGLLDDAANELQTLAAKNPASELAHKLRDSLVRSQ